MRGHRFCCITEKSISNSKHILLEGEEASVYRKTIFLFIEDTVMLKR